MLRSWNECCPMLLMMEKEQWVLSLCNEFFHLCTKEEKRRKSELLFWVLANQRWMVSHFSNSCRLLKALLPLSKYLSAFLPFFFLCPLKNKWGFDSQFLFCMLTWCANVLHGVTFDLFPCFKERKAWIVHKHLTHLLRFALHFLSTFGV